MVSSPAVLGFPPSSPFVAANPRPACSTRACTFGPTLSKLLLAGGKAERRSVHAAQLSAAVAGRQMLGYKHRFFVPSKRLCSFSISHRGKWVRRMFVRVRCRRERNPDLHSCVMSSVGQTVDYTRWFTQSMFDQAFDYARLKLIWIF